MLSVEDMKLLIETEDEIHQMDKIFEQLTGQGHENGEFVKLDNVYDVIQRNAHSAYIGSEEADLKFMEILYDKQKTAGERAEILLSGNV